MQPTAKVVNDTLKQIERTERDPSHPRTIARQAVKRWWKSDAERQKLPVTNQTDSGAPLLHVNRVLNYDDHDARLGRK